jgi:hypothetical protein
VPVLLGSDASEETFWSGFDFSGAAGCADGVESDEVDWPVSVGFWVCGAWAVGWLGVGVVLQCTTHRPDRMTDQSTRDLILNSDMGY